MKQNTKRLYSLIFAMLFVVLALVVYFDMLIPAYSDLQAAKGNQISEANLLANEKQVVGQIQGLLATYKSQASDEQAINAALPVGPNAASAISQLYGISAANDISLQGVALSEQLSAETTPTDVAGAASLGQITKPIGTLAFTFAAAGSYENFKNFLQALQNNMRFFDVEQIAFHAAQAPSGGKGTSADFFSYSLTAQTYYQSP